MFTKLAILLLAIVLTSAQLSFRTDANSNMYSIQTPSFQSTFTRYFGQPSGAIEAAEARPQAQIAPAPTAYNQAFGYKSVAPQSQAQQFDPASYQQQQAADYQQQTAAYQQQSAEYRQPAQQQPQFSAQDIAAYLQQQQEVSTQQLAQQQTHQQDYRQHQQLLAQQQVGAQPSRYSQTQATAPAQIQYSPSNEVSSVKFSSGALKYNF